MRTEFPLLLFTTSRMSGRQGGKASWPKLPDFDPAIFLDVMPDSGVPRGSCVRPDWNEHAMSDALYAIDASRRRLSVREFYARGSPLVEQIVDPFPTRLDIDIEG
jgi:hypothetical protein